MRLETCLDALIEKSALSVCETKRLDKNPLMYPPLFNIIQTCLEKYLGFIRLLNSLCKKKINT